MQWESRNNAKRIYWLLWRCYINYSLVKWKSWLFQFMRCDAPTYVCKKKTHEQSTESVKCTNEVETEVFFPFVCIKSVFHRINKKKSHQGKDVCLLWVLCVVRWRSLRRADHSSRGVLLTVMRHCVWSRNLKNWGDHGPRWAAAPQEKKKRGRRATKPQKKG